MPARRRQPDLSFYLYLEFNPLYIFNFSCFRSHNVPYYDCRSTIFDSVRIDWCSYHVLCFGEERWIMCTDIRTWIAEAISEEASHQRKSYSGSSILSFHTFINCIYCHSEWNLIIYGGLEFHDGILLLGRQFDDKWLPRCRICQDQFLFSIFYKNINIVWTFNGILLDKSIFSSNKEI